MKRIVFEIGVILVLALVIAGINNTINPHRIKWVAEYKTGSEVKGVVKADTNVTETILNSATAGTLESESHPNPDGDLDIYEFGADDNDSGAGVQIYEIGLEESYQLFQSKKVIFVDARYPADYKREHIKNAINLPADMFDEYYPEVADFFQIDDPLLIYCSGPGCDLSALLADILRDLGYTNLMLFEEGLPAWKAAGYPVN